MKGLFFVPYYFHWHYFEAPKRILRIAGNFIWFTFHFFSIGLLARTLFSPWMRLQDEPGQRSTISSFFTSLLVNTIIRVFGALFRSVFIIVGLLCVLLLMVLTVLFLGLWFVFPFILLFLILMSLVMIIKSV